MDTLSLVDLVGRYGRYFDKVGILVDHVARAEANGFRVHEALNGGTWVVAPDGTTARVLCGHLVETVDSEGYRGDGRCGQNVAYDRGACFTHADERDDYLADYRARTGG